MHSLLRLTTLLAVLTTLLAAPAIAQTCSAQIGGVQCNGNDNENDCDGDGCRRGFGDCNDCDSTIRGPACPGGGPRGTPIGAAPEICDGKDNNCSLVIDEGPGGAAGTVDAGLACTIASNQGVCRDGTTTCTGMTGVVCTQNVMSSMETCDGRDNDCDGDTDETGGVGTPKLTRSCFPTPASTFGTPGVGVCTNGAQACNAVLNSGVASYTACGMCGALATCATPVTAANPPANAEMVCDGLDNDCDTMADDGVPGTGGSCTVAGQQGRCAQGVLQCRGATGIGCVQVNTSQPETCNGIDDDCDGFIDEVGNTDLPKLKRSCFPGPGTAGQGICVNGEQACNAAVGSGAQSWTTCGQCGALATCSSPVTAVAEVCDTLDNDCDGTVNNGNPGGGAMCTNTAANGVCRAGTQTCLSNGTLQCNSTITPGSQTEICDGLDNDCDGATDETGGVGSATLSRVCYAGPGGTFTGTCGSTPASCSPRGECRGVLQVCPGTGGFPACTTTTTGADGGTQRFNVAEVCNGRDDDCNGTNDNNVPGTGGACSNDAGMGSCGAGTVQCVGGALVCQGATGTTEVCDGIDNDCDGDIDESGAPFTSMRLSRTCYGGPAGSFTGSCQTMPPGTNCAPRGVCRGVAIFCQGGAFPACSAGTVGLDGGMQVFPGTESCNTTDDDCDGNLNNGLSGGACMTGEPGVCGPGTEQCTPAGTLLCVRNRDAGPELCNNLDDNCNGIPDDNVAPRACFDGPAGTFTGQCGLSDGGTQGTGTQCLTRGTCRASTQQCNGAGNWLACGQGLPGNQQQVLPAPEICNNQDEDCNGTADNGLIVDVDNDMVRACGTCGANPDGGCDCADNNPNVRPGRIEACNGLDDNCNGAMDEASAGAGKISQSCYSGPANTAGRGVCVQGTQECNADAGSGTSSFGACMGQVVPSTETCNMQDDDCNGTVDDGFDQDNDTFRACMACGLTMNCDCDDTNPMIRPGAVELCDTVDQNCNGRLDDVTPRSCYADPQGMIPPPTTYTGTCPGATCQPKGVCRTGTQSCTMAGDWGQCMNVTLPRAEQCDGTDDDCDGVVDNGMFDRDMDTFVSCALCSNRPADAGACDCNDNDPAVKPGAPEVCDGIDNNCDLVIDGNDTACYSGPPSTRGKGICADGLQTCSMGMGSGACRMERLPTPLPDGGLPVFIADGGANDPEFLCDGRDEDCDGIIDDGFDLDGDGVTTCQNDCDDTDPFNKPGGKEICDCKDNNCNTTIDDSNACRGAPCFDFDGDGFTNCQGDCNDDPNGGGRTVGPTKSEKVGDGLDNDCDGQVDENTDEDGDGFATGGPMNMRDCNDKLADVNPGAVERCDGFDNNCDGVVDEGFDLDTDFVAVCAGDCNDMNPAVNPTRVEVCGNATDDNCDGRIDEDTDNDGDGVSTCAGDCNDFNAAVHGASGPTAAAAEVCDGQDNDCDRLYDEGFDQDNDGTPACFGDCNDMDPNVGPRAFEVANNSVDDNCDGQVDEGQVDRDMDGFPPVCGDCNDFDARINPRAAEVCNRVDDNCDSYIDSSPGRFNLCSVCFDADGDGQTNCDGDCNDADRSIYRGAPEICDLKDNDCDQQVDIDPGTGRRVCTTMMDDGGIDAGAVVDAGTDAGQGEPDGGGMVIDEDAGIGGPTSPGVVTTGCGCGATDGSALLAALALLLLASSRRSLRRPTMAVKAGSWLSLSLVALLLTGCPSSLTTPMFGTGGGSAGGGSSDADGGDPDGGLADGGFDAGFVEPENWPCPGLGPLTQNVNRIPGAPLFLFASSSRYQVATNAAAQGLVFDDGAELAGFVLQRDVPSSVNPLDPVSLETVANLEVDALIQLSGSPLVRDRLERSSRIFVNADRPLRVLRTLSTSQLLTFGTPTSAFAVRNRLLASLSGKDPGLLGTLPTGAASTQDDEQVVNLFFRFSSGKLFIGAVVSASAKLRETLAPMNDFSNGSHLSDESATLATRCEKRTTPALKTDFLFVVDNTISMVEEQQALQDAAQGLFDAFQRAQLDFRVGVVTTDSDILRGGGFVTTLSDFRTAARVGLDGNTTELGIEFGLRALRRARMATAPNLTLRDPMNTGLVVIFMSDEDNKSIRPGMFGSYVTDYRMENAVAFSIVGPKPTGCIRVGRGEAQPGGQYIDLANATGGSSGSICNPNLTEVIEEVVIGALGASSRTPMERRPISGSLAARTTMPLERNRTNGFDYEPAGNSLLFFGQAAPMVGTPYDAAYQFFNYID